MNLIPHPCLWTPLIWAAARPLEMRPLIWPQLCGASPASSSLQCRDTRYRLLVTNDIKTDTLATSRMLLQQISLLWTTVLILPKALIDARGNNTQSMHVTLSSN